MHLFYGVTDAVIVFYDVIVFVYNDLNKIEHVLCTTSTLSIL